MRNVPTAVVARRCCSTRGPTSAFVDATQIDPGNLLGALRTDGDASCVAADFTGDGRCDVLLAPVNQPPVLIENVTRGGHWIAFDLAGKRPQDRTARSNQSAIGARVEVKTGAQFQQYVVGGSAGPVASLPLRSSCGARPARQGRLAPHHVARCDSAGRSGSGGRPRHDASRNNPASRPRAPICLPGMGSGLRL